MSGLDAGRPFAAKIRATAAAWSALAPNPYTVSVGNATSLPAQMRRAASAIALLLGEVILGVARRLAGLAEDKIRVHQRLQLAIQHTVYVANRELGAMILNQAVRRQNVAANLAAEVNLQLVGFRLTRFLALLFQLGLIHLGAKLLH